MKNKLQLLLILVLLSLCHIGVHAQNTILASGGNASGNSSSYSIGQIIYNTNTGVGGSVSHGVQQPFEISGTLGTDDAINIAIEFKTYPNPTAGFLTLKINNYQSENLSYQLYDVTGKLLRNREIISHHDRIAMENFSPGMYVLKIVDNQKDIKTFKIIKN